MHQGLFNGGIKTPNAAVAFGIWETARKMEQVQEPDCLTIKYFLSVFTELFGYQFIRPLLR